MANENLFQELSAQEQAIIAGGANVDFDAKNSLLGNAFQGEDLDLDLDLDFSNILDSLNFGKNDTE